MRITLQDLKLHPNEVAAAAQQGTVEVIDAAGQTRFWLSIPGESLEDAELTKLRLETHRLRELVKAGVDSQEFYELMQTYRHADFTNATTEFEAVKAYVRGLVQP